MEYQTAIHTKVEYNNLIDLLKSNGYRWNSAFFNDPCPDGMLYDNKTGECLEYTIENTEHLKSAES